MVVLAVVVVAWGLDHRIIVDPDSISLHARMLDIQK